MSYYIEPRWNTYANTNITTYAIGHYASGDWVQVTTAESLNSAMETARLLNNSLNGL